MRSLGTTEPSASPLCLGTDPPSSSAKAQGEQGGDFRKTTCLTNQVAFYNSALASVVAFRRDRDNPKNCLCCYLYTAQSCIK